MPCDLPPFNIVPMIFDSSYLQLLPHGRCNELLDDCCEWHCRYVAGFLQLQHGALPRQHGALL